MIWRSACTVGYDVAGRFNALSHNIAGSAQDVAYTYAFNPASQIVQQTRNNQLPCARSRR